MGVAYKSHDEAEIRRHGPKNHLEMYVGREAAGMHLGELEDEAGMSAGLLLSLLRPASAT